MQEPNQKSSPPKFYTIRQAAVIFQVREQTVSLWLRRGLINGVRIGHTWRIPESAFEDKTQEAARET